MLFPSCERFSEPAMRGQDLAAQELTGGGGGGDGGCNTRKRQQQQQLRQQPKSQTKRAQVEGPPAEPPRTSTCSSTCSTATTSTSTSGGGGSSSSSESVGGRHQVDRGLPSVLLAPPGREETGLAQQLLGVRDRPIAHPRRSRTVNMIIISSPRHRRVLSD